MLRNVPRLTLALLLSLAAADPALAGGGGADQVQLTLEITIRYRADGAVGRFSNSTLPASELTVGVFSDRNLFGVPQLLAVAETDATGRVVLRPKVATNKALQVHLITDSSRIKTFPGAWNVFTVPHARTLALARVVDIPGGRLARTFTIDAGVFSRALHVQHVAGGTIRFFQERFATVRRVNKISASFPGWIGKTYAPFAHRIVIKDEPYMRDTHTIAHETCHTVWYQTRGRVEYYWPMQHSWDKRASNPSLALSEGWAYAMALPAVSAIARRAARPLLAEESMHGVGERHYHAHGSLRESSRSWDHDGEANVLSALYDLWDTAPDALGVDSSGYDRTNGGDLPAGVAAQRLVLSAIRRNAERRRPPNLKQLWSDDLRAVFGNRGRDTLRLNGVRVDAD